MASRRLWSFFLVALALLCAGATPESLPRPWPGEELAGGDTTVFDQEEGAFGRALLNLDRGRWPAMRAGKALFEHPWRAPGSVPATAPRQGLGPRFNATACADCHFRDGRGGPPPSPLPGAQPTPAPFLLRLSLPHGAPDPRYGHQLNDRGVGIAAEGRLTVTYEEIEGAFPDGVTYRLRRPRPEVSELSRGPLDPATGHSLRIPPTLVGMGLLEAVPEAALEALADPEDADGDGISGRLQRLPGPTGPVLGRFGWKAGQPTLEAQVARAFHQDLGVTSALYPEPNCAEADEDCRRAAGKSAPVELDPTALQRVTLYTRLLAPPARRDHDHGEVLAGRETFQRLGCGSCHRPELRTAPAGTGQILPELADQTIRPFTDLLLHDMGPELADGLGEHEAAPSEWRTAPLWGLGLQEKVNGHLRLLHDGRAHSIEEAILWHGGEAERARDAFRELSAERRHALLRYLRSL
jgi:CxxC motif-containing protein (DUF1111 family)